MIIMPSTPRLRTPERSTTSSPAAASKSGVEAAITARMMASSSTIGAPRRGRDVADAVNNERVAGEHVEQQHPLEHLGQVERHFEGNLRALATDKCQSKKQA